MGINQSKDAFEKDLENKGLISSIYNLNLCTVFDTEKNEYFASDTSKSSEDKLVDFINYSWGLWQINQERSEFILVPKSLLENIAEDMAKERVSKPREENDPVWLEIAENSYKSQIMSKKWELIRDYKTMINLILERNVSPTIKVFWISVKDQMPEPLRNVLVLIDANSVKNQNQMVANFIPEFTEEYHGDDDWYDWSEEKQCSFVKQGWYANTEYIGDDYSSYFINEKVTHWMQLPEELKIN